MKYNLNINQEKAIELGLNLHQAHIFELLGIASSWADEIVKNGYTYYFVARQKICDELPLLDIKPDTAYRHLKTLAEKGLIEYIKDGKKDLIKLTKKGKKYYVGNKSEKTSKLGNKSEKNSEINPTYTNTRINIKNTKKDFENFLKLLKSKVPIKSKVTNTQKGFEAYKLIEDKNKIIDKYISHQKENGNYSQRITAFLEDYEFYTKGSDTYSLATDPRYEDRGVKNVRK